MNLKQVQLIVTMVVDVEINRYRNYFIGNDL